MYQEYFGLKDLPFSIAPNPQYLYMSDRHREALAHLLYGIKSDGGFLLLTGEVGTGKTTVCRCLLQQIPEDVDTAYVLNPKMTGDEMLATVCDELHIEYPAEPSTKQLVDVLSKFLIESHQAGRRCVVIIDEAQNLSVDVLEQLRLLTNLETNKRKLLQIILLGQPELLTLLAKPELRQLSQRVTARFHLSALTVDEVSHYIKHRLDVAGARGEIFANAAVKQIFKISQGIPRLINLVCDRALLGAYTQNQTQVNVATIKLAAEEILGKQANAQRRAIPVNQIIIGILLLLVAGLSYLNFYPLKPSTGLVEQTTPAIETVTDKISPQLAHSSSLPSKIEMQKSLTKLVQITTTPVQSINGFSNESRAFTTLFSLWGIEMIIFPSSDPCNLASASGLRCIQSQAGFGVIQSANLPALIWRDNNGEKQYFIVTAMTDTTATLLSQDEPQDVLLEEFEQNWRQQSIILQPQLGANDFTSGNIPYLKPATHDGGA